MADIVEVFRTLEDESTGAGEALISRIEGEAAAAQAGSIGFAFKDASGNVILPQLTADGKIMVDTEALVGQCLHAYGSDAAPVVNTPSDLATLVLDVAQTNSKIAMSFSCFRDALYEVVYIDDVGGTPTETVISAGLVGAGQYIVCCALPCNTVDVSGGTGVQNLVLRGTCLQVASTLRGELSAFETTM